MIKKCHYYYYSVFTNVEGNITSLYSSNVLTKSDKRYVYKSAISFVLGNCEHITRLYISEEKSHSFNFSE